MLCFCCIALSGGVVNKKAGCWADQHQSRAATEPDNMSAPPPLDWNTVTADLQRSVNNCALYVLESMTPPTWLSMFLPQVDVTQPPPGYEVLEDETQKPPAKRRSTNDQNSELAKKKKPPAAASHPAH